MMQRLSDKPKGELCALKDGDWIRVSCTLVEDDRFEASESVLDAYPELREMYTSGPDGNSIVYYMKDATATIASFTHDPIVINF